MLERRWARWALIFAGWTFLGLFFASQTYLTYLYTEGKAPGGLIVKLSLAEWYVWAVLTPPIVWLARRFPLERGRLLRALAVHVPVSLVLAAVKFQLDVVVRQTLLGIPGLPNVMNKLHPNIVTYWVIVGLSLAYSYYRKYQERELRASQLEAQLAQAELQALRMQLHPHFLFNTLHAIATLVHRDPEAADRMIARLSDLLRLTLENLGVQEVPLKQELEFLERYLEIEKMRFAERLAVALDVAPEALDARVPYLLLQPLVENAIRHAVAPRAAGGRIELRAAVRDSALHLELRDDGPGLSGSPAEGLGLANTRARLERLYGPAHHFALADAPGGGLLVRMKLPLRFEPEENSEAPRADR